jgi:ABC-type branched-subunit amino acid transport system ATPase component
MTQPILSLKDVTIRFGGIAALRDVNMEVEKGSIHGLIGPNGAGKTTLLNVISRFVKPQTGTIFFDETDLLKLSPAGLARIGIARTFQNLALIDQSTVRENVIVGLHHGLNAGLSDELFSWGRRARLMSSPMERVASVLEYFGLGEFADKEAGKLSYGQRKMVELARAWVPSPRMLLLDEPTAGLNVDEIVKLQKALIELRKAHGLTILVITHHIEFLADMADQVTVLNLGTPLLHAPPATVREDPRVIAAYLGAE